MLFPQTCRTEIGSAKPFLLGTTARSNCFSTMPGIQHRRGTYDFKWATVVALVVLTGLGMFGIGYALFVYG